MLAPWKEGYDQPREYIKKQRHYFANKGPSSQSYGFSSSRVWMWQLDCKESKGLRIDAFELWCWIWLLRVRWTARRPNQSILKEVSPEYLLETETPIFWPPDVKNWLIWKDPDAGKDWRREKGSSEDEMVGWHHWRDGPEFEWTPGVGDWQGSLACCSPWGHKELETTEPLNWTECGFISCNKCTSLSQDVDSGGQLNIMGAGGIQELSVLPTQFCCEPKTALKNKAYLTTTTTKAVGGKYQNNHEE